MFSFEFRRVSRDIAAGLANDFEISDDCILNQGVRVEIRLIQGTAIVENSINCDEDMSNLVRDTVALVIHSGCA